MNTIIQTPTGDLAKSLDFYLKLQFKQIEVDHATFVTDGKTLIQINPEKFARAGVKIFKEEWSTEIKKLKESTNIHKTKQGYLFSDPSNVWVYLIEGKQEVTFAEAEESFSTLGKTAGLSLETMDIDKSILLWEILGFSHNKGNTEQGWAELKNKDGLSVSFMNPDSCPHLFFNPSLTYFNGGKNLPIIAKIIDAGIPITEEITHFNKEGIVDNVILRDPGGFGFFIFND